MHFIPVHYITIHTHGTQYTQRYVHMDTLAHAKYVHSKTISMFLSERRIERERERERERESERERERKREREREREIEKGGREKDEQE